MNVLSSLKKGLGGSKDLPRVDAFSDQYAQGMRPREGQLVMVAGRSGAQKSGFVLYWVAQMGLPTLYFSGDMSAFTAGSRMASIATGYTTNEIEELFGIPWGREQFEEDVRRKVGHVEFAFSNPLTFDRVVAELNLFVLLRNELPKVVVLDNLMDFDSAQNDYEAQMQVMQDIAMMTRDLGVTTIVLHHATDKSQDAQSRPYNPPARREIKNGLAEKPELCLTVALGQEIPGVEREFNVAVVKQRDGPNDPTGNDFSVLYCDPARTRFWARDFEPFRRSG